MKINDYPIFSDEQLNKLHTKQLLKLLRSTYSWWDYDWEDVDNRICNEYRNKIKSILKTREHIPNKQESKAMRKYRKKYGIRR